ncbi:MAG: hypothetical protein EZS28_010315 [Streblomastix strix]|uniref:Cyclin N-terminal domain-containing protein n=1 Tax=Streblomastix strix TaxID=222440 RepID=A0A5J4WIL3_9EUKA|nr:MAG: hypothetical protein EZS28_010315 [Streblomastix strix]
MKQFNLQLASRIYQILEDAVPGAGEVTSVSSITTFFKYLQLNAHMQIKEQIMAIALLQQFIHNQAKKSIHVLNKQNIGTMFVVLIIITMKTCRDVTPPNSFFANEFDIQLEVLNKSERTFLKVINHEVWIDENHYSQLFEDIMKNVIVKTDL